ncbi:MAG: efflux RND transporter periplasmic adaptor subunit [Desulfatiglandales bacterium]
MKARTLVAALLVLLVVIGGSMYILVSLRKAAAPPEFGKAPSLDEAPVRVYGLIEPLEREVFVGPLQARRVTAVLVKEGAPVKAGQILCTLDADIERQALRVAESRLEEALRRLELTLDDLRRKKKLVSERVAPEFELSRLELQAKLEEQQIATSRAEVELHRVEIMKLTLRSPIAGMVYKMDVRVGELLTPQDFTRLVLGCSEKQVRLFLETFWLGRVRIGDRFTVREAETLRDVGSGIVEAISPYVGARDFRTEDSLERLDTKYAQAILRFETPATALIGMQVICERHMPGEKADP